MLEFEVDVDMCMAAPGESDSQIATRVMARDRSHTAEVVVLLAYQSYRPHESVAGAVEDIDPPDVHPNHPFDAEWRNVAVYLAGVH